MAETVAEVVLAHIEPASWWCECQAALATVWKQGPEHNLYLSDLPACVVCVHGDNYRRADNAREPRGWESGGGTHLSHVTTFQAKKLNKKSKFPAKKSNVAWRLIRARASVGGVICCFFSLLEAMSVCIGRGKKIVTPLMEP